MPALAINTSIQEGYFCQRAGERADKNIFCAEKAKKLGVLILAMEFGPEHFHAFLVNWKKYSVEKLANEFKGFTSYMMRKFHRGVVPKLNLIQ